MPPVTRRRRSSSRGATAAGGTPAAQPGEALIWTDGACLGNPGPGGWAALVCPAGAGEVIELIGGLPHTTNNVMELTAALEGLRSLPDGAPAGVVSDSRYVVDGMTSWLAGWKHKGWMTAGRQPVKNRELWMALDAERERLGPLRWLWVRGHVGNELNERADRLAVAAVSTLATSQRQRP